MESLTVKLYYDPEKWDNSKNYKLSPLLTPTKTRSLPSKIVKLQYSARRRLYETDTDASPSRSSQRQRARTPTPPEIESTASGSESGVTSKDHSPSSHGARRHLIRQDLLKRTYQQSLQSMKNYQQAHSHSELSDHDLENIWYYDLQNVSLRLHYLREVHKAIQTLKKRRNQSNNKDQKLAMNLQSSNMGTPLPLEDEGRLGGGSSQGYQAEALLQPEDEDSSGSNTDQKEGATRATRRRVQFLV